jgi:hypothetical protein
MIFRDFAPQRVWRGGREGDMDVAGRARACLNDGYQHHTPSEPHRLPQLCWLAFECYHVGFCNHALALLAKQPA